VAKSVQQGLEEEGVTVKLFQVSQKKKKGMVHDINFFFFFPLLIYFFIK
jgi:hypothetical protein